MRTAHEYGSHHVIEEGRTDLDYPREDRGLANHWIPPRKETP